MKESQTEIFLKSEADRYFARNSAHDQTCAAQPIIELLRRHQISPSCVLDIGCAGGAKTAAICREFSSKGFGIEPSKDAVAYAQKSYPDISFHVGEASALDSIERKQCDLVIINFVLHWVARELLLKTISEIDRVLRDGGHLLIGDFDPPFPCKVHYHHLPDQAVFTYKQDYASIFTSSQLYSLVAKHTYQIEAKTSTSPLHRTHGAFTLLKKSFEQRYVEYK